MSSSLDPRIDAYIESATAFAQPILRHLRACVHRGCPQVVETIKWSIPHFTHTGGILCGMAAFKAHCTLGFWHEAMTKVVGPYGAKSEGAMGSFGRITSLAGLPDERTLIRFIREAAKLNDSGIPARPKAPAKSGAKEPSVPNDLVAARCCR